mmetsp:Transcript_9225/g.14198  ORF Transcript_9225/g.14198 Transcript_9225/m.14198 type:complete len:115 (-) Transcript_9225:555-899(-)|eukprot:CAMPEP_0178896098 /NCGR_PEP_ID=MMETSP0786-20121207/965_1 /TAXON_ID=186022 /ORGANISM="Thalassionema frauenfeldii, Strain CCMP 1798" /LENGTH=114 /DNA_ID=CAMNT_0020566425 /DNA_START=451 /DNA_END=795 /DNA_ORIENTATION=+
MLKTRLGSENVLPLCQSIRSPHYEEADQHMATFHRKRQAKIMLFILMAAASTVGVIGKTTNLIEPEYALRRRLNNVDDEPNMFTPRIVADAILSGDEQQQTPQAHNEEDVPPLT